MVVAHRAQVAALAQQIIEIAPTHQIVGAPYFVHALGGPEKHAQILAKELEKLHLRQAAAQPALKPASPAHWRKPIKIHPVTEWPNLDWTPEPATPRFGAKRPAIRPVDEWPGLEVPPAVEEVEYSNDNDLDDGSI